MATSREVPPPVKTGLVAEDTETATELIDHLRGVPIPTLELRRHGDGNTFLESLALNFVLYSDSHAKLPIIILRREQRPFIENRDTRS